MRSRAPVIIALLLAAALAGCGSEDDCCALPPKEIGYDVKGGYPPFRQELEIGEDGRATLLIEGFRQPRKATSFTVDPTKLDAIRGDLDAVDFDALVVPERSCFDCPSYEIRYGPDEFAANRATIPPELIEIFERLDHLVDGAGDSGVSGGRRPAAGAPRAP